MFCPKVEEMMMECDVVEDCFEKKVEEMMMEWKEMDRCKVEKDCFQEKIEEMMMEWKEMDWCEVEEDYFESPKGKSNKREKNTSPKKEKKKTENHERFESQLDSSIDVLLNFEIKLPEDDDWRTKKELSCIARQKKKENVTGRPASTDVQNLRPEQKNAASILCPWMVSSVPDIRGK